MALTTLPPQVAARSDRPADLSDTAPIYTRFSAAPRPQAAIGEPRYIHALMIAAWLGRLIDPVDLAHHPDMGLWSAKDAK